jgi:hypothetical protein
LRKDYRQYLIDNQPVERFDDDFYNRYSVRTDLALEATEVIVEREGPPEIPGVVVENEVHRVCQDQPDQGGNRCWRPGHW